MDKYGMYLLQGYLDDILSSGISKDDIINHIQNYTSGQEKDNNYPTSHWDVSSDSESLINDIFFKLGCIMIIIYLSYNPSTWI